MAHLTILRIWPGERYEDLIRLEHGYSGAPRLYDALCARYLSSDGKSWLTKGGGDWQPLWDLCERVDIPTHERALLMMTFDRHYVARENYARAAADIDKARQNLVPWNGHWQAIQRAFEQETIAPAIGGHWYSAGENTFEGPWNDETGTNDQIDWSTAREVYAEMDRIGRAGGG